jgi:hypothetical protein
MKVKARKLFFFYPTLVFSQENKGNCHHTDRGIQTVQFKLREAQKVLLKKSRKKKDQRTKNANT